MRSEGIDMAGRLLRLAAVAVCLVVAPLPVMMIGACDYVVLKGSHWRFQGARRWGVMMFLNSVMFLVSGLFSPACAFPLVALVLGAVMSSAFFLSFPERRDDGVAMRTRRPVDRSWIDVEVIDNGDRNERTPVLSTENRRGGAGSHKGGENPIRPDAARF